MQGAGLQGLLPRRRQQAKALRVRQCDPAHPGAVARFGGFHIGDEIIRHRGFPEAHPDAVGPVDIVFLRAPAKEGHLLKLARHRQLHPRHGDIHKAAVILGRNGHLGGDGPVAVNGIDRIQPEAVQIGISAGHGDDSPVLLRLHVVSGNRVFPRRFPGSVEHEQAVAEAGVVVGSRPEKAALGALPRHDQGAARRLVADQPPRFVVEYGDEALPGQDRLPVFPRAVKAGEGLRFRGGQIGMQFKLLHGHGAARRQQAVVLPEDHGKIQKILAPRLQILRLPVQGNLHGHAAGLVGLPVDAGNGDGLQQPFPQHGIVPLQRPMEIVFFHGIGKQEEIADLNDAVFRIRVRKPDGLIEIPDLRHFGLHRAIGQKQSVGAEIPVVDPLAVIAAVAEVFFPVLVGEVNGLVDEIPNEAALEVAVGIVSRPVLVKIPFGIPHGVLVFTFDHGHGAVGLSMGDELVRQGVHPAAHVDARFIHVPGLLVMPGAILRILVQHPFHALGIGIAFHQDGAQDLRVLIFVAQAPHDDGSVVSVPAHHAVFPVDDGLAQVFRQALVLGGHVGVALDVGLVHHIDAVFVAQVIPVGVVGVMAGAYGIDVVFQHDPDILLHYLFRNGIAVFRVGLMPVHAPEGNGLSVDADQVVIRGAVLIPAGGCGFVGDLAEAHPIAFVHRAAIRLFLQHQGVQIRVLGAPFAGRGNGHAEGKRLFLPRADFHGRRRVFKGDFVFLRVEQAQRDGCVLSLICVIANERLHVQGAVGKGIVKIRHDGEIPHPNLGRCVNVHVPEDAGEIEHILILDPAAVAPAVHLHGDQVLFSGQHIIRNIKFMGGEAVLGVARLDAVDPQIHGGVHALKVDIHPFFRPFRRQRKRITVKPDGVIRRGRFGQIPGIADVLVAELPGEFLGGVGINGVIVALRLPYGGDENFIPGGIVKIRLIKRRHFACFKIGGAFKIREFPIPLAQQLIIGRQFFFVFLRSPHSGLQRIVGHGIHPGWLPADGHDFVVSRLDIPVPFQARPGNAQRLPGDGAARIRAIDRRIRRAAQIPIEQGDKMVDGPFPVYLDIQYFPIRVHDHKGGVHIDPHEPGCAHGVLPQGESDAVSQSKLRQHLVRIPAAIQG